jgi:hypothetical protein
MDQNEKRMWEELERRKTLLLMVASRAIVGGERIVLIYPALWPAKEDMHTYYPREATLSVSDMRWRFKSDGWVMFRTVAAVDAGSLRGLLAEFIWVDDAERFVSARDRDEIAARNSYYRHRMNSRYPVDEPN